MSKSKKGKKQRTIDTLEKQLASRDKSAKAYVQTIENQLDKIARQKVELMKQSTVIGELVCETIVLGDKLHEWKWTAVVAMIGFLAALIWG